MLPWRLAVSALAFLLSAAPPGSGQTTDAGAMSQLIALRDKVGAADTRVRVAALHRIPAINAQRAVEGSQDPAASQAALDLLAAALDSSAMIGGMEVRMMAVAAMEKVGLGTADLGAKAKAMGLLQAYASRGGWEPEAQARAQDAATAIRATVRP